MLFLQRPENRINYLKELQRRIKVHFAEPALPPLQANRTKPTLEILDQLTARFHSVARQILRRYKGRKTLEIADEYDVQNLMYALLKLFFDDIRPEEYTPTYAGSSSRMDFVLKKEQTVLETKMTRDSLKDREVGDQLLIDISKYQAHPDCKMLYCFVYDREGFIRNPTGLENDLSKTYNGLPVKVVIAPHH